MDASILKYMAFIKTVECGSFTRAAELLNYSQSGVSRMINDLETEWHVKLLERSRGGVRLTSDGVKLLPYAKNVCEDYRRLQMQIDDLNGLQTGIIRIGTFASVTEHWLPRIISRFRQDYPNIDYELLIGDYSEIEQWIADGRVDCGFLCPPIPSGLDCTLLERDELAVVLPVGHRLAELKAVPLEELCTEPFMLLERGARGEVSEFRQTGAETRGAVQDPGRLCGDVHGGMRAWSRDTSQSDTEAHSLPPGDTQPCRTRLPGYMLRAPRPRDCAAGSQAIH